MYTNIKMLFHVIHHGLEVYVYSKFQTCQRGTLEKIYPIFTITMSALLMHTIMINVVF